MKKVFGVYSVSVAHKVDTAYSENFVGIKEKAEDDEPFDEKMKRLTSELGQMFTKSHELEEQIKKNLEGIGWKIN